MRRLLVALTLVLALAGCSSGNKFPPLAGGRTTTTLPEGARPTGGGTPTSLRAGTGNAFCDFLRTYNERFGRFNAGLTNPQELRTVMNEALAAVKAAEANAPSDVKADMATTAAAFASLVVSFGQANFDVTKLRLEDLTALQDPKFLAASQRLDTYIGQHCT